MQASSTDSTQPTRLEGIISTTQKGIGFLKHPDLTEDVRIEAGFLNAALNRDLVEVQLLPKVPDMQQTGEVVRIIKRARTKFVGVIEHENGFVFAMPDDRRFYTTILLDEKAKELVDGDKVYVEMHEWTDPKKQPLGTVLEVLGHKGVHEVEIRSINLENGIDDSFPAAVEKEAEQIHHEHQAHTPEDLEGREDVRTVATFTIDPADAKDFDDALSVQFLENGNMEVGIHIADVTHYVKPGSALDTEGKARAYSVYLVDRTIPMLPEVLSNDLCSLKPDVDRLTFSVWAVIDKDSKVVGTRFGKSIIHSQKRFTYEEAQEILNKGEGTFYKELVALNTHAKSMRDRRMKAGSVDFEQREVKFELADDGTPLSVYTKERLDTHKLIEEYMLLANFSVAEHIMANFGKNKQHVFVYRTHDHPDREKLKIVAELVKATGHELPLSPKGDVTGQALNKLFAEITGLPEENLIKTAALRSMAKAAYTVPNIGHFGLAAPSYSQFTSPIRRYADMIAHRLLFQALTQNTLPNDQWALYNKILSDLSQREVNTVGAERDSIKYKQVEYMSSRIGQVFDGVISGVSEWGVFVEEKETRCEGLVSVRSMNDDFYTFDAKKFRLVGRRSNKTLSLGDVIRVKVEKTDLDRKTIDYSLVQ